MVPPGVGIEIAMDVADGNVRVGVRDEGSGFPPGSEETAFERFWRAEEARDRSGSGIGLAIVKATAERHGGQRAGPGLDGDGDASDRGREEGSVTPI